MSAYWGDFRSFFTKNPEPKTAFDILYQQSKSRAVFMRWWVMGMLLLLVGLYILAMYKQQAVIAIFEKPIETDNKIIRQQAVLLGALLSPQRIALLCEYPSLYGLLGYNSPYTGTVIQTLSVMEPSIERVVMALTLLESGLVVDPSKTSPPTIFNEVIRQVYPNDDFQTPQAIYPPKPVDQTQSTLQRIIPIVTSVIYMLPFFV